MLLSVFAREPELFVEVFDLFWREQAPYKSAAAFDYLFIASDSLTSGTEHSVVGFRLRSPEERRAALTALDPQKSEALGV